MNCIRKTAFGAKNLRISYEVGMMPTVVSVRHGEHLTSTSRMGVLTPVDDRGILLYIPTRAPQSCVRDWQFNLMGPSVDLCLANRYPLQSSVSCRK